jgi:hypothetical protein
MQKDTLSFNTTQAMKLDRRVSNGILWDEGHSDRTSAERHSPQTSIYPLGEQPMVQTQKDMVLAAAEDVFKANITTIFQVLDKNLITAGDDVAKKNAAIESAKKGLESAQKTRAVCLEIANTLP